MKMNKDLETDTRRVKAIVEKEKSALQKNHSKILKNSEKDGYEVLKQFQTIFSFIWQHLLRIVEIIKNKEMIGTVKL